MHIYLILKGKWSEQKLTPKSRSWDLWLAHLSGNFLLSVSSSIYSMVNDATWILETGHLGLLTKFYGIHCLGKTKRRNGAYKYAFLKRKKTYIWWYLMICDDIFAYLCETSTSIVARSEDPIAKMKFFENMEWLMNIFSTLPPSWKNPFLFKLCSDRCFFSSGK